MAWHCRRQCPPVHSMLNKAQQGFTRYHVQKFKQLVDAWCKLRLHMQLSPLCAASSSSPPGHAPGSLQHSQLEARVTVT